MIPPTPARRRALALRAPAFVVACLAVASCLGDPTGPSARSGSLAFAPRYANALAAVIVDVSAVRITLRRPGTLVDVVDTVVAFPADADELQLSIDVPLERSREEFELRLAMTNAQGDTVFRAGPTLVTAVSGGSAEPEEPTFTYVGVGANAAGVRFVEPPSAVPFGATVTLEAEAFDGQQNAIPGTPIGFELVNLADTVRARITDARAGTFVAGTQRGDVAVRAVLASGQVALHTIAVQPVASSIVRISGNNQSATVGQPLSAPLVARVVAADALGVQDVEVDWHVVVGTDTVESRRDTTDATGHASYALTLSGTAGTHTVHATIVAQPAMTVSFTATAVPAAPAALSFQVEPGNTNAAEPFAPAVTVAVLDGNGNVNAAATDVVTLAAFDAQAQPVALNGTTSVAAVAGVATFTGLSIDLAGTGYTLQATAGGLVSATSVAFDVAVGPAVELVFTQQPLGVVINAPFAVEVRAHDAGGNQVQLGTTFTIALGDNPGGATLGGTLTADMSEHQVDWTDLTLNALGAGYTLVASTAGLPSVTSEPITVNQPPEVNSWINPAGGNWSTAANWSQGTVPSSTDTVWIALPGNYTVTIDQPVTVGRVEVGAASGLQLLDVTSALTLTDTLVVLANGRLNLLGGALTGPGDARVQGHFGWEGGDLTGAGIIRVSGTMTIAGTAARLWTQRTIELGGLGLWANTHTISSGLGATWRILAGGNVDVQGDASWIVNQGGDATLDVQGGLLRTTSAGTVVAPSLAGNGTLTVLSGTLETRGTGAVTGTVGATAGATLAFGAGTHTLALSSRVEGDGTVRVLGGATVGTSGVWSVTGTTEVLGNLDYNGPSGQTGRLDLLAGRLGGTGTFEVTTQLAWDGGNVSGGGGVLRAWPGSTTQVSGAAARLFTNHELSIGGTGSWSGAHTINSGLGAILRVEAGAEFAIDGTPTMVVNQGGATSLVVQGSLAKVATGTATLPGLEVSGILDVQLGTVIATGSGVSTGTMQVAAGALLQFANGTQTLIAGSTVTGDGFVQMGNGSNVATTGTWSVDGTTQVTNGMLTFNGSGHTGTLLLDGNGSRRGAGLLLVNDLLQWNSGDFSTDAGTTRLEAGGSFLISGLSARLFTAQTIEVAGTGTWAGSGTINSGGGAILRVLPGATLAITGAPTMVQNQGGTQVAVDVQGDLTRTTSAGTATLVGLSVGGSAQVLTGVLDMRGDASSGGAFSVAPGAELRSSGGAQVLTVTSSVTGGGLVHMAQGTLTSGGTWNVPGTTRIGAGSLVLNTATATMGTLDIVGGGSLGGTATTTVTASMTWTGGMLDGGLGTVHVDQAATFASTGATGRVLRAHELEIAGSGLVSGAHTWFTGIGAIVRITPTGVVDVQGDLSITHNQGGTLTQLVVEGQLQRTTSAGPFTVNAGFSSTGSLSIASGSIALTGGGSLGGNVSTSPAGTLALTGGNYSFAPGFLVAGTGSLLLNGATVTGGAPADTASIERLTLTSGTLAHGGVVRVPALLDWNGNAAIEAGTVRADATLSISGTAGRLLRSATLENAGTATWTGDAQVFSGLGARLVNLAGATFNWDGDGDFVDNQGAPQSRIINEGTFEHNGAGITGIGAYIIDTVGTAFRVNNPSGEIQAAGGGRFGGAGQKYTGGDFIVAGGIVSLMDGAQWTSDGGYVRINAGTLTVDSAATATVAALEVTGGTLQHEGTLTVANEFLWSGGVISSTGAAPDLGGTTVLGDGAIAQFTGAAKLFSGVHTIVNPAGTTIQFDGAGDINAGQGVRIVNAGTFDFDGTGGLLHNQGGTADFVNTGVLSAGSTTTAEMEFRLENAGGELQPNGAPLVLRGGSINAFTGTSNGSFPVQFDAAVTTPFTLTGPFTFNNPVQVTAGVLGVGASTATVNGDLVVSGSGRADITQAAGVLAVNGNATFGGAPVVMSAGRLDVAGDFTQAGTGLTFNATGSHVTRFLGNGQHAIAFQGTVSQTANRFASLELASGTLPADSVYLASNAYATGNVLVTTGRFGRSAPHRLIVEQDASVVAGAGVNVLRPFVLEVGGTFPLGLLSISPDTLVLNRTGAYTWATAPTGTVHQRFHAGDVSYQATSAPADLIASGNAILRFPAPNKAVFGNLETRNGGVIAQLTGSDLSVTGNATFNGGSTSGLLTGGRLTVNGNFAQLSGNSAASYAPSGDHVTWLGGATGSVISFVSPTVSNFDSLVVDKGQSGTRYPVTLMTDVRATGGMTARGAADITGPTARLSITGGSLHTVIQTMSPTITSLRALELSAAPTIQALVAPDTVVYNSGVTSLPVAAPLQYRSIRLNTGAGILMVSDTIANDLDIQTGVASFLAGSITFRVGGKLRTRGTGLLQMATTDANLTVVDSAIFGGASTNGNLTAGSLTLMGHFIQQGNAAAFSATGTHSTRFAGTGLQTIRFANPDSTITTSHFATLWHVNPTAAGIQLESPVYANGQFVQVMAAPDMQVPRARLWSAIGAPLVARGINTDSTAFDGVPLRIANGAAVTNMSDVRFLNMPANTNHFELQRAGGTYSAFNLLDFQSAPSGGFFNVVVRNTAGTAMSANFFNSIQSWAQMTGPPRLYQLTVLPGGITPTAQWNGQTLLP